MPIKPNYIPTILIVDDEPFNLEFLSIILKQHGYNIITANNGRDGRDLAEVQRPDLILLDIMMPGETGFECAAVLRLSPETSEIPIIFLTALDDETNRTKGYDAGAVDFIVKPFDYKEVLHRIRLHLIISANEKLILSRNSNRLSSSSEIQAAKPWIYQNKVSLFPDRPKESPAYFYETVIITESKEGHLILNFTPKMIDHKLHTTVSKLLADNTGPLYTPSDTIRNIGVQLKNIVGNRTDISGVYAVVDRELETLTIVNAGALPVILLQSQQSAFLIERRSGNLGSLGTGLPPCSTYRIKSGERLFMFSQGMTVSLNNIKELREACELSSGVDLETACHAAGEMLQSGENELDGILIAIEV